MNQRERDEAAIRSAASACVEVLRGLNGVHQDIALTLVRANLQIADFLDNEASNRAYLAPAESGI